MCLDTSLFIRAGHTSIGIDPTSGRPATVGHEERPSKALSGRVATMWLSKENPLTISTNDFAVSFSYQWKVTAYRDIAYSGNWAYPRSHQYLCRLSLVPFEDPTLGSILSGFCHHTLRSTGYGVCTDMTKAVSINWLSYVCIRQVCSTPLLAGSA